MTERKENQPLQLEKESRFVGTVIEVTKIPNSPFSRASLDNGFSVMLVPDTDQIKEGDKLRIISDTKPQHLGDSKEVKIARNKKFKEKIYISKCQIVLNKKWDETTQLLIEQSKKMESPKHKDWWKKYYESQKPKRVSNPNWLEDLRSAASFGIINGYLD